jgi:hypothetical protein
MVYGLLILYQHNNDLGNLNLYVNSTQTQLYNQDVTTTNTTTYSFTPTHKGYLAVAYSTNEHEVELFARLRKGYIGDTFQGKLPAYYGNEVFLLIPVVPGEEYVLVYKRASSTGHLNLKVFELY